MVSVDDVIKQLPHSEAEINAAMRDLRELNRLSASVAQRIESLNEHLESEGLPYVFRLYVRPEESKAYAELIHFIVGATMKIAAPNLEFGAMTAMKMAEAMPDCTLRDVIEITLKAYLGNARNEAYEQIVNRAKRLLPYRARTVQEVVKGRKLCLQADAIAGRLHYNTREELNALDCLMQVMFNEAPAEQVTGLVLARFSQGLCVGDSVPVFSEFVVSLKLYKNLKLEVEFASSDYAHQVGAVLLGLAEGQSKVA